MKQGRHRQSDLPATVAMTTHGQAAFATERDAGAVLSGIDLTGLRVSPGARHAVASYELVAGDLAAALHACASGQELASMGYAADVDTASDLDVEDVVPVLTDDGFVAG
jgi:2-phosphosulfolactate phosphatase